MPFKFDANNNLDVNVIAGGGAGSNAAAGPTGAPVPADADYVGYSSSGTLTGVSQSTPLPVIDAADDTIAAEANSIITKIGGILAGGTSAQPVHLSAAGNLNVNLAEGTISGGNAAAGLTGAAVPTSADYTGFNSGGNLVGVSTATPLPVAQQGAVTLGTGSAVVGHVIADSGSTTAVTGNVTVVQGTGTNLHVVVDTAPSTVVTQATGTNLHTVVDSGSITATQATGTNLHTVVDSGSITANAGTNLNTSALLLDSTFTGRINTLGSKVSASSTPVVIASDQGTLTVTDATIGTNFNATAPTSSSLVGFVDNNNSVFRPLGGVQASNSVRSLSCVIMDGGGVQLAVGDNSTPPDTIPVGIGANAFDPVNNKIRSLTVDTNQNLKVSATSLPLPTNAAQETSGNLALIASYERNNAQVVDVLNCILAQLKLLNMNLASSMPSAHTDTDTWLMDIVPVLN